MMKKNLCVILVNYCHPEITVAAIKSIINSSVIPHIIVVDNASPDNSYEVLSEQLSDSVTLIKAEKNLGFAAGNNIGIRYALEHGFDYIMLLNNDTHIATDMIEILMQYTNDKTVTSPKMFYYNETNRIWFAGGKYHPYTGKFSHIGENEIDSTEHEQNLGCDFLTGCCFMMTADTVRKVGYLDERYFMYYEDVDYSLRMKKEGINLMMIPKAKLWHKVGISSGGGDSKLNIYYGNRNRLYIQKKFGFSFSTRLVTLVQRIMLMLKGVVCNTNQKYIWYSITDYYANRMGKQESRA